jgi:serine phosphatase RsbU (regulator of sigma subunit)
MAIYLRDPAGRLALASSSVAGAPPSLDGIADLGDRLVRDGQPREITAVERAGSFLSPLEADCLVPVLSRRQALIGLLVLGTRLSEEPYSRADKLLLSSVAGQAGGALENLMLAEEMADRIETERRAAREMEVAAEVQRRLFPALAVPMATVEYAARCEQARLVGGDYYDFLDLGPGRLGFALADVSGKGLYASLLMAHLQASLRSLSAGIGVDDLPRLLEVVNRSFCASTAGNHFATLFVGRYDDDTRRLTYANCGHHPPFLVRADGSVERLAVTARAIGLFDELGAVAREVTLAAGDLLGVFSDGVTEAMDPQGEEFGEARLLQALLLHRRCPVAEAVERAIEAVGAFSGPEQSDDVTLMVIRAR